MAVPIDPRPIAGSCSSGWTLDQHTASSEYLGEDQYGHPHFDTVRTPVGELLYALKYNQDLSGVDELVATAVGFLASRHLAVDAIVPVPPSKARANQPVRIVASRLATALGVPFIECVGYKGDGTQLKNVLDQDERERLLENAYAMDPGAVAGMNILLVDDLFRSGQTFDSVSRVLIQHGKAKNVRTLAFTRTRRNA